MKRLIAGIVVVGLVAVALATPTPAYAHHRGHFFGGLAVGAVTGLVVGSIFAPRVYAAPPVYQPAPVYVEPAPVYVQPAPVYVAPPPPVVYQPAPVYVQPAPVYVRPAPVCSDYWAGGYWQRVCR